MSACVPPVCAVRSWRDGTIYPRFWVHWRGLVFRSRVAADSKSGVSERLQSMDYHVVSCVTCAAFADRLERPYQVLDASSSPVRKATLSFKPSPVV